MKKYPELEGKTLFWDESLYSFLEMTRRMGLVATPDNYAPEVPLLARFQESKADLAMYSVLSEEDGHKILELPVETRQKFLIFKNQAGDRFKDIANVYQKIEGAGLVSLYEHYVHGFEENFAQAFLQILAKQSTATS